MSWHRKTYDQLIARGLTRGLNKKSLNGYFEKHHIIPKCLGGTNKKENLVLLTYREHLIAHRLLIKIFPEEGGLRYALHKLLNPRSEKGRDDTGINMFSSRELEQLRNSSADYMRKINLGKHHSEESKEKMRRAHLGKKASDETKEYLSKIRMGHSTSEITREKISLSNSGKFFSEDHRRKISRANKGKTLSEERKKMISGEKSNSSKKVLDSYGRLFDSIAECAKTLGISVSGLKYKIKQKGSGFKVFDKNPNKLVLDRETGVVYKSIKSCAKALNRSDKYVSNICKNRVLTRKNDLVFVDDLYCKENNIIPK